MALKKNVIYIYFKGKHLVTSKSQYQYNHGQFLYFADLDLPQTFEVHFSNTDEGYAKPQIGSNRLVEIPDPYFWTKSSQIYAWIYLHEGNTDGETKYEVIINLERKSEPVYEEILPTQQTTIERAIAELNNAVDVTTENANKTGEDRTQVSNIKDEIIDLKEDIDANAELATEKAQEAVNASLRSETSAQNAAEYESNAHDYSDEAKDYAQQALESKTIASQKATIATDASVETLGYRDETLVAKNDVLNLKQDVIDYKNETKGYLDETKGVRADVQDIDNEVKDYASQAQASATSASQSATASANSASASAQSASEAQSASTNAETYALNSGNKAVESAQSASASANSATQAQGYANDASASAQSASGYASSAQTSANTASSKASEASQSATTASTKASEASTSASQALSYKNDAESAKTASQTAQGLAEDARDDAQTAQTLAENAESNAESTVHGVLDSLSLVETSGSIVETHDAFPVSPEKMVVDINPIQDLHGQDVPYPAGGGANKWDEEWELGSINTNGDDVASTTTIRSKNYIPVVGDAQYYFMASTADKAVGGRFYDANKDFLSYATVNTNQTFTVPNGAAYMRFVMLSWYGTTYNNDIAVNYPSTVTTYSPYENICPISGWTQINVNHSDADMTNPTTITIPLGQTVYGGHLDVLTGELVIDWSEKIFSGEASEGWYKQEAYNYFISTRISDAINVNAAADNFKSNTYPYGNIANTSTTLGGCLIWGGVRVRLADTSISIDDWKNMLSETPLQVCYRLATPITIQLTPTQITLLKDYNALWADTGDISEFAYRVGEFATKADIPEVPVKDVKVNGESVVQNEIANIDLTGIEDTIESLEEDHYKPYTTDIASGAIASFPDGADGLPLKSLVVDINPVQDLHGQDAPYPAGGGKNLFDASNPNTVAGYIGSTAFSTGNDKAKTVYIPIKPNTTYTVSKMAGGRFALATSDVIPSNGATFTVRQANADMAIKTITSGENDAYLWAWVYFQDTDAVTYEEMLATVQIEEGSTATSYAPYENICPISGWTQVDANHSDADMTNPTTITIDLGQTVYGGKLDVLSGVLTVENKKFISDGSENWGVYSSFSGYYVGLPDMRKGARQDGISNMLTNSKSSAQGQENAFWLGINNNNVYLIGVYDSMGATLNEFKAYLAEHNLEIMYPLATPIEIQLTPHEVNSLLGANNIWADTGDTEVEYRADTKLYISKKIAEAIASITQNETNNVTG